MDYLIPALEFSFIALILLALLPVLRPSKRQADRTRSDQSHPHKPTGNPSDIPSNNPSNTPPTPPPSRIKKPPADNDRGLEFTTGCTMYEWVRISAPESSGRSPLS